MKLLTLIVLFSIGIIFLNLNHSEAQISSTNSTSNATSLAALAEDFYNQGNDLFDNGTYSEAIIYYDKALDINSTNINALYNKALAFDRLGNITDAITNYQKVLAITPDDTDTLNNIGLDLDILGKHEDAITYYDKAIAIAPNDTALLYNKGLALDSLGQHDQAISYYRQVLEIDPTDADALNKMNLTYNNANKTQVSTIQKTDQTSLMVTIGLAILVAGTIIAIEVVRSRRRRNPEISQKGTQIMEDKKSTTTETEKDDWEGI